MLAGARREPPGPGSLPRLCIEIGHMCSSGELNQTPNAEFAPYLRLHIYRISNVLVYVTEFDVFVFIIP